MSIVNSNPSKRLKKQNTGSWGAVTPQQNVWQTVVSLGKTHMEITGLWVYHTNSEAQNKDVKVRITFDNGINLIGWWHGNSETLQHGYHTEVQLNRIFGLVKGDYGNADDDNIQKGFLRKVIMQGATEYITGESVPCTQLRVDLMFTSAVGTNPALGVKIAYNSTE